MVNNEMLNELDFEKQIKDMADRPLLEFIARQSWETASKCKGYDKDIEDLKGGNRKASTISGGITGTIAGIIIALISYFQGK